MLLFLNLLPGAAASQYSSISGYITEKSGKGSIPGVSVSLEGRFVGTITDGRGYFMLDRLERGEHRLLISFMGYNPIRKTIELKDDTRLTLNFELEESLIELEGIVVERVSLTGGGSRLSDIPGSAHYIRPQVLERFNYTDINRVLAMVPGVILQEEDGFGLRPNIGLRGTGAERSSRITLMEDGILSAPAPYSAPAAYYFPSVARMQGVEVRKGSSQIKYGPYTTGGAINMLSTPVPRDFTTRMHLIGGNYGFRNFYGSVGQTFGQFGILAEALNTAADGFKNIVGGGDSGFSLEDYTGKLRYETKSTAQVYQSLQLKLGYTRERSHETYLGLTREDFDDDPYLRYAGSQADRMDTDFRQFSLRHAIRPASFMDITTTLYHHNFSRNWYKLDKVKATESGSAVGIAAIMQDPEAYDAEYGIITGRTSGYDRALSVKANNRSYYSRGVETILGFNPPSAQLRHNIEIGLRLHQDQMDRFQWVDDFRMIDSVMMLNNRGIPGTESNRIEASDAVAGFTQYTLHFGRFVFTPGVRYENIRISRDEYGTEDPDRSGTNLKIRQNHIDIWIPGFGVEYNISPSVGSFLGIHKGFAPPGSAEGTLPEESINYEIGLRLNNKTLQMQTVAFYNDYSNLLGADLAAGGGAGTGDLFNGGAARVVGLETEWSYNLLRDVKTRMKLPLTLAYTFTRSTFQSSFDSTFEPWGRVNEGDEQPYTPTHQIAAALALQHAHFDLNLNARYNGSMRTVAGSDPLNESNSIPGFFVMDISTNVRTGRWISLFGSIQNLTDAAYIVSERPAGFRPGLPRSFRLGLKVFIQ